jgi:chemotaxis signal transduction protein
MSGYEQRAAFPSRGSLSRFLIVTMGGRYLAFNVESIQGTLTIDEAGYERDPTIQGMLYRTVDLLERLGVSGDGGSSNSRIVLLSERGIRGCIRVSKVHGVLELRQSQVLALPAHFCGPERHWYRGMILFEKSVALVLDTVWVLTDDVATLEGRDSQEANPQAVVGPEIVVGNSGAC